MIPQIEDDVLPFPMMIRGPRVDDEHLQKLNNSCLHHDPAMASIIETDPDILGGTPVIRGTRIPVSLIYDMARLDYTVDQILEYYPDLTADEVIQVLEIGKELQESLKDVDIVHYLERE